MPRDRSERYGDERITLRQTLVVAIALHLMLGGVMQWKPDLLWSDPLVAQPESNPLEFRFVDTPETATEETPETDVMSDVDRVAADQSERDDAEDPFSEGNTPQEVLRSDPEMAAPPPQPEQPAEPTPEAVVEDTQPTTEETIEAAAEETPVTEDPMSDETVAPPENTTPATQPLANAPPPLPPSTRNSLRNNLTRGLQQFVQPEIFANSDGGASGQGLVQFDTKGYDLGAYISEVLRIIERNWKNNIPPAARVQGMEGAVFVSMSIKRDEGTGAGTAIIYVSQSWSSGIPAFDQAALFALEISSPLPPLPSYFPHDQLDGRLGFLYNLDPSQVTFPDLH